MKDEEATESSSLSTNPIPSPPNLNTKEEVAEEIKKWIEKKENDEEGKEIPKSYDNAVSYIELKLKRKLSTWETTWIERQYVITLLKLWLKKSFELEKAFQYLGDEKNDISKDMSTLLSQLDKINSFDDIHSQLNDVRNWNNEGCRYLQLILGQTDLFRNTPCYTVYVKSYLKQFKISFIDKVFSRCIDDIVKDERNGEKNGNFITKLNEFLAFVNKEKNLIEKIFIEKFQENYVEDNSKTGQDLVEKLVEIFVADDKLATESSIPDWWALLNDVDWTPKLQILTNQIFNKFLLPKTEIEFIEEDGKRIISIKGVVIFVSKMIEQMKKLKEKHPDVEEIKFIGFKSVHIDCDLDNENWHGTNIGIITDELIVDDVISEESGGFCWNVSGKNAITGQLLLRKSQPGESGGNVAIIYHKIINGQNWTIVSDGSDGSSAFKWTREEFEKRFPSMSAGDKGEAMDIFLTTLKEICPPEKLFSGKNILPGHKGNFLIQGFGDYEPDLTAIFYKGKKGMQTLIHIKGGWVGQGGYGGDIAIECFATSEVNEKSVMPLTGKDSRPLTAVRFGVYEASGRNGKIGKKTGDVGFIEKGADGRREFFGLEKDENIEMIKYEEKGKLQKDDLYVKYENERKEMMYAKLEGMRNFQLNPRISESAIKKKSVIRQSLVLHLDEIDEWNRLTKSIEIMLSNPTEHKSNNIDEIISEMEDKVHQLHQRTTQRQQHQKIELEKYVRPAIDSSRPIPKSNITGRRPDEGSLGGILDELSTEDGTDNLLHCLFGKVNSEGKLVCKDTNYFRKWLAKYIREKYLSDSREAGEKRWGIYKYNGVVMFLLRVNDTQKFPVAIEKRKKLIDSIIEDNQPLKGMETQLLRWLNHNDDYDDGQFLEPNEVKKWNKAWKNVSKSKKIIKEKLLKGEVIEWKNKKNLIGEYAKYIESPTGTLGFAELEMLKIVYDYCDIFVFKEHGSLFYQHKETFEAYDDERIRRKPVGATSFRYILYGNGKWKRLSPCWFKNIKYICNYEDKKNSEVSFRNFKSWVNQHEKITDRSKFLTCIEKFNPQNKTPNELSRLIRERIAEPNMDADQINQLMDRIRLLSEWVDYYNTHNFSPIFYLTFVGNYEPKEWITQFLLFEIIPKLCHMYYTEEEEKNLLKTLINSDRRATLFTEIVMKREKEIDILLSLDLNKLERILKFIEEKDVEGTFLNEKDKSPLIDIFYQEKSRFWWREVDEWMKNDDRLKTEKKGEYVNLLLELEYKNKKKLLKSLTENSEVAINYLVRKTHQEENSKSRNEKEIIAEMDKKWRKKSEYNKLMGYVWELKENEGFLCNFGNAFKRFKGLELRDAQRVAIATLLREGSPSKKKKLAQVSTGEGKSIIVAGVAICLALRNEKKGRNAQIDVITSNDVLAIRDSSLSFADGGLKELYDFFNVTVANNCSKFIDDRKRAYNMDVVYGTLANFQRDHLLDDFYNYNIRGDRMMNYVIIDEVDCMLLDRGNNILYLSHDIPGMEMLESIYLFIWENIKEEKELIKSAILFDLHGQINKEHLKKVNSLLGEEEFKGERIAIWEHLIEKKVIDRQGRLLVNDVKEITEEKINYTPINESLKGKQLNPKIVFFLHSIVQRERRIRIPSHLLPFVDRHLDTWLDNARRALELKQDENYVIDYNRSDTSPDLNPQVIIIDPDTGTDQSSSQWDGGLHQFLQLKEGCKLTLQTLKAVFISNYSCVRKYGNLAGVSGTLGSQPEQEYLKTKYDCDLFTIPTALPKRFSLRPPKLFKTEQSWRNAVTEETRRTIIVENRSIIVFCRFIKEVNKFYQQLKSAISDLRGSENKIHHYTRDYEKFEFESKILDEGHVIVSTNLAGRGTDIKISDHLKTNGGLHICLTYFPENERVEDQAMGRAARKGEPGSGILILCESPNGQEESDAGEECWGVEKIFAMKEKRAWEERQRISRLEKDFKHIERIEELFGSFTKDFRKIKEKIETNKKGKLNENVILKILDVVALRKFIQAKALDKWALWLDETDYKLNWFDIKPRGNFTIDLDFTSIKFFTSLTPARRIEIAKHFATIQIKEKHKIDAKVKAVEIFNELMNSTEKFLYPAAFYYRAFILLTELKKEKKNFEEEKIEFIRLLRHTETILNEKMDMQMSFIQIHTSERKSNQTPSFITIDGYKEQKENNIEILQCFLGSIQWMLGSRCSILVLREAASKPPKVSGKVAKFIKKAENFIENKKTKTNEELKTQIHLEKVNEYFKQLIKSQCIGCELNEPHTIPNESDGTATSNLSSVHQTPEIKIRQENRSKIILQIADEYGVSGSLEDQLTSVFEKTLNEEEIEKKLKKMNLIPCTRKTFWKKLVDEKALNPSNEWEFTECFIMSEKQLEELQPKLDRREEITLEFGIKSFDDNNRLYVLYNPTFNSQKELRDAKKIMFSKEYVKRQLLRDEYRKRKEDFESNKIAQLDLTTLKNVNLESFGRLCKADLGRKNIDKSEREGIWNQLVQQNIIDDRGYLVPNFDIKKDFYPECPAYEKVVMRLVGKKFVAEIVRQQWLKVTVDNPNCLKAIHLLPRKPYGDMLADLMAAHVISGARVTEHFAINLEEEVKKITDDHQERECLMEFLTNHQSVFAEKPITPEFFLDFIERDLKFKFSSELHVFRLAGFDQVIDIRSKDLEWTFKSFFIAGLSIFGGLASIGGGVALNYLSLLSFGVSKNLFFMGGLSDTLYAVDTILSRKDFTWADYGRQRIRSAMGKTKPIDAIKVTWELYNSSKKKFKHSAITNEHRRNKPEEPNEESIGAELGIQNYAPV